MATEVDTSSAETAPAAVLEGPYGDPYKIISRPIPSPAPQHALIRLSYSGICNGDLHARDGHFPAPTEPLRPLTGGHEGVGMIVSLGENHSSHFKVGDMVGIAWRSAVCGDCDACKAGAENYCMAQKVTGMHSDGTYQSYISFPIAQLIQIPPGLDLPSVCSVLCAGVTAYKPLQLMDPVPGKWCVVVGAAGAVGHFAIQYAKRMGLRVLAIDGSHPVKKKFCLEMGADKFVDFTDGRSVDIVLEETKGGAEYVLVISPYQSCYDDAAAYIRFRGQLMAIGVSVGNVGMPVRAIYKKDLTIRSHQTGTRQDIEDALKFTADERITCKVEIVELHDLNAALDRIKSGKVLGKLVLDLGAS